MRLKSTVALAAGISFLGLSGSRADLIDGLVEYWELEGDFSAGIDDTHEGTLQATGAGLTESGFVAGKFGQGYDFESSDAGNQTSIVIGGDENDFDFTGASMSLSIWYTTESLYRDWQCLAGKGEGGSWRLARNSTTNNLKISLWLVGPGYLDQQDGSWHHAVAALDETGHYLYVDGELVASNTNPANIAEGSLQMQIGGNPQAANRGWDGILDDVGIWDRALTEEEVRSIWNEGNGASIASLIGASGTPFAITEIVYSPAEGKASPTVTLSWNSRPGETYIVNSSFDLANWTLELEDGIAAEAKGETTTRTFELSNFSLQDEELLFFRVEKQ